MFSMKPSTNTNGIFIADSPEQNEIDSDFIHPLFNESVKSLLDKTTDTSEVTYYKDKL